MAKKEPINFVFVRVCMAIKEPIYFRFVHVRLFFPQLLIVINLLRPVVPVVFVFILCDCSPLGGVFNSQLFCSIERYRVFEFL